MRFSLSSRITLAILGLICLLVPVLAGVLYSQFSKSMEESRQSNKAAMTNALLDQAKKRGLGIAGLLAESLANPFYYYRIDEMRDLVDSAASQRGVISVFAFDSDARVVLDGTDTLQAFGQTLEGPQVSKILASGRSDAHVQGDVLFAYVPIKVGTKSLGGVEVGVSLTDIRTDITQALNAIDSIDTHGRDNMLVATAVVTLVFVLVGILFSAGVARGISQPIEQLVGLTRRIGRGETSVQPPVQRNDEIGELAAALCLMAQTRKEAEDEARRLQSEIARFSRVSAAGEMATSLAHELNQPLAAVSSFVSGCVIRLKKTGDADPELLAAMNRASEEALRAGEIIRRVRGFVQKNALEHQVVDLNETIRETVELAKLDAEWQKVRLKLDLHPELPLIRADRIQMQQVVFNILRNAIDALGDMPRSRKEITIETEKTELGEARVRIRDYGPGIQPEMRDGIFDPFVTSKHDGLGMGLPICRSIIESHAGTLRLDETSSSGTAFSFTLKHTNTLDGSGDAVEGRESVEQPAC